MNFAFVFQNGTYLDWDFSEVIGVDRLDNVGIGGSLKQGLPQVKRFVEKARHVRCLVSFLGERSFEKLDLNFKLCPGQTMLSETWCCEQIM